MITISRTQSKKPHSPTCRSSFSNVHDLLRLLDGRSIDYPIQLSGYSTLPADNLLDSNRVKTAFPVKVLLRGMFGVKIRVTSHWVR